MFVINQTLPNWPQLSPVSGGLHTPRPSQTALHSAPTPSRTMLVSSIAREPPRVGHSTDWYKPLRCRLKGERCSVRSNRPQEARTLLRKKPTWR